MNNFIPLETIYFGLVHRPKSLYENNILSQMDYFFVIMLGGMKMFLFPLGPLRYSRALDSSYAYGPKRIEIALYPPHLSETLWFLSEQLGQ
jgi:hypothetical protein